MAAGNLRDRLLVRFLYRSGCRITEALSLQVDDVDFVRGTVTIHHLKTRTKLACPQCNTRLGKAHSFCPKCGMEVKETIAKEQSNHRFRTLPLDSETLSMFERYVGEGGPVVRGGRLLVFGIHRGQGWRIVRDCARKAGLGELVNPETGRKKGISPHRLRDAFAVHAVKHDDSGDGLRLLQEHLGHASFNTTAKYRKVAGDELRSWYEKLWRTEESADG